MMGNFGKTIIVIFVWLAWFWVSPALAEGCEGWRNGQQDYWQNVNLEQVKTCLDNGADLTVYDDKYKATPLHWAASANRRSVGDAGSAGRGRGYKCTGAGAINAAACVRLDGQKSRGYYGVVTRWGGRVFAEFMGQYRLSPSEK